MAVFSAIGSFIATTVLGLTAGGLAATVVSSVVALGLGIATAKITGVFDPPKQQQQKDPGVKVQLPPATDNKVPVFYGRSYTGGIIVDAEIKNRNNTMVYCMVIGEKTDSGSYSITNIYRDDQTLNFGSGGSSHIVQSVTDTNATASNKVQGKMRCRVFAGNAQSSANQIFPTTGTPVAAQTLMTNITASTNYEDLVYAIFEIDYDPENGLQGLGGITYDINNTLNEPSNVLLDYLKNDRYGVGLADADLDLDSFNDMYEYSNINGAYGNVAYTTTANVTAYHSRWQIDGMLSTYQPVKTNIDELCKSASTFFTYDSKQGKFKVVPLRALTTAEKANCFVLNDDNIISDVEIASTELYDLYNSIEADYPSVAKKDQTDVVIINTPSGDRNAAEPDNPVGTRYDLVNDSPRVHNLANIDLRQSRVGTIFTCTGSYETLQIDIGDVVKVNLPLYGYSDKLFRVIQLVEQEAEDSMIGVKITALEYNDDVYDHSVIQSDGAVNLSGIPGWWTGIWGNVDYSNIANIIAGNITIIDDPQGNTANIVDPPSGNILGNIDIGNIDFGIGGIGIGTGGGLIPSINVPITIPDIPDISEIIANITANTSSTPSDVANTVPPVTIPVTPPGNNTTFIPGEVINITIPEPILPPQDFFFPAGPFIDDLGVDLNFDFKNYEGASSVTATAPNITLAPQGSIDRGSLGAVQAGLQVEDDVANINTANSSLVQDSSTANVQLGTANSIVTPFDEVDLGSIDEGFFSAINSIVPYGGFNANSVIGYSPVRQVHYKEFDIDTEGIYTPNANADVVEVVSGSGLIAAVGDTPIPSLNDNFKYEVTRDRGSTVAQSTYGRPAASDTKAYIPKKVDVVNYANTNLSEDANLGVFRGFDVTNSDKRITKSDFYIDIGGFF